jgi:Putative auto-transporter adhesin, head GIN domain
MDMKIYDAPVNKMILILELLFTICSCSRNSCPILAGNASMEMRVVPGFKNIILYDKVNLVLTQDSVQKIIVATDKNLLPGIRTDVNDSTLTIQNNNGCNWLRNPGYEINVYISSSLLQYITYYGAGNINSTNTLRADQFTVDSWSGTGSINLSVISNQLQANVRNANATITLSGQSTNTTVYCADAGSVNLVDLESVNVSIDQKSVRDCFVNVSGLLNADIVYRGNLYYKGNPVTIDSLITSSGRLIRLP